MARPLVAVAVTALLLAPCSALARGPKRSPTVSRKGQASSGRGFGQRPAEPPSEAPARPPPRVQVRAPTARERTYLEQSPHNTGMALLSEGKFEEAGLSFEKALDLDPDAIETWSALGVCMTELGQPDAAIVCQKHVLRLRASQDHGDASTAKEAEFAALASDADALPSLPGGRRLQIATGSLAECDTGGRLWSSGGIFCSWLRGADAPDMSGSSVIELGSGTGSVGLYAAGLGAASVLLTDGGPPGVLELAAANAASNEALWAEAGSAVEVQPLEWGPDGRSPAAEALYGRQYDWVVGSDLTYSAGAHAALCWTIGELLRRSGPKCRALLAHQRRVSDDAAPDGRWSNFLAEAAKASLAVDVVHTARGVKGRQCLVAMIQAA